jgi:hypothetical protein
MILVVLIHGSLNNQTTTNSSSNSSIDKFLKVDGLYYSGNLASAKALNASITCTNSVESVYKTYYNLYDKFIFKTFNDNDNNSLAYIAELCPGTNGTAVYKARALYNYINQTARNYFDNCGSSTNAKGSKDEISNEISLINKLQIELFPNPAQNFVTLFSNKLNERLSVEIIDVGGKVTQKSSVTTIEHLGYIDLELENGIYFVTITNSTNDKVIKKLIISK